MSAREMKQLSIEQEQAIVAWACRRQFDDVKRLDSAQIVVRLVGRLEAIGSARSYIATVSLYCAMVRGCWRARSSAGTWEKRGAPYGRSRPTMRGSRACRLK